MTVEGGGCAEDRREKGGEEIRRGGQSPPDRKSSREGRVALAAGWPDERGRDSRVSGVQRGLSRSANGRRSFRDPSMELLSDSHGGEMITADQLGMPQHEMGAQRKRD